MRETTEGLERDETILARDRDRRGGESARGNGFLQNCEGRGESSVLICEGWDESGRRALQGLCAREKF